jgi:hypothetical protein
LSVTFCPVTFCPTFSLYTSLINCIKNHFNLWINQLSAYIFIFNKMSLLFHPIFLNLTCAYLYLYNLLLTASYVCRPYIYILLLSTINSGKRDEMIKKFYWK